MNDRITRVLFAAFHLELTPPVPPAFPAVHPAVLAPIGAVSAALPLSPFSHPERLAIGGAITPTKLTRR